MSIRGIIKTGEYYDSVMLMQVAREISEMDGVDDATVVMGTRENKSILKASGLYVDAFREASDADLLIAVKSADDVLLDRVLERVETLLDKRRHLVDDTGDFQPKSLEGALTYMPDANLVLISVAGKYAGDIAMDALKRGLHVMLFSDNVSAGTERSLKEFGRDKGLLVMGPDCGTAVINGVPLAFANAVPRGNIGIIGASGTGMQEISAIIASEGVGISQAIGTGGRDIRKEIGGIMFIEGLRALVSDPATDIIVMVSKPPDASVLHQIEDTIKAVSKPVVAAFLGWDGKNDLSPGITAAETLEEAALLAAALAKGENPDQFRKGFIAREREIRELARAESKKLSPGQKYLRGLFSGGTLCVEAQLIFRTFIGDVYGNVPLNPRLKLTDAWKSSGHTVVDLGEDEFTVGRLHPMIDYSLRKRRICEEAEDPGTAVILLDVVLGFGSNMSPGEELSETIRDARRIAKKNGRYLPVVCSVTGTMEDPQNKGKVVDILTAAGARVMPSNTSASLLAGYIVNYLS